MSALGHNNCQSASEYLLDSMVIEITLKLQPLGRWRTGGGENSTGRRCGGEHENRLSCSASPNLSRHDCPFIANN